MRVNRRKIATFLYRAGCPFDLHCIEIIEAIQIVGFEMIDPPIATESEITRLLCKSWEPPPPDTSDCIITSLQRAGFNPFSYLDALPPIEDKLQLFGLDLIPPLLLVPLGITGIRRLIDFFALRIENRHTRRAYATSTGEFIRWCKAEKIPSFLDVKPFHISRYFMALRESKSLATAEQRISAIRHLYDWLAVDGRIWGNPVPGRLKSMALAS